MTNKTKTFWMCVCAALTGMVAWLLLPTTPPSPGSIVSAALMVALGVVAANVFAGSGESRPPTPEESAEASLVTHGQRKINLIWEYTQAIIALMVVASNLIVGVQVGLTGGKAAEVPPMLSNALFLVVGFYFSRTNHAAIGGVGRKPEGPYVGR